MSTASTLDGDLKVTAAKALRAAREAREARIKFWRVFAVTSFFAVVLGANMFVGVVLLIGNLRTSPTDDPDLGDGRVAQVTHKMLDGTFCRYITYDNKTAQTIEDKVERCDSRTKKGVKRKSEFSWGGR